MFSLYYAEVMMSVNTHFAHSRNISHLELTSLKENFLKELWHIETM